MARGDAKDPQQLIHIAGTVPPEPANGLLSILKDLQEDQGKVHIGIVFVDASWTKNVTDSGQVEPVVRLRQFEFPAEAADIEVLSKMADRLQAGRTYQPDLDMVAPEGDE